MTTYTKETALYDTGAISGDITEAGQTATNYITADPNGIKIHMSGNNTTYQHQTASGTTYYVNGLKRSMVSGDGLKVYVGDTAGSETEVASFGETTRIGKTNAAHFTTAATELTGTNGDGKDVFSVDTDAGTSKDMVTKSVTPIVMEWSSDQTETESRTLTLDLAEIASGETLLQIEHSATVVLNGTTYTNRSYWYFGWLQYGTSATRRYVMEYGGSPLTPDTYLSGITIDYDGGSTITVTSAPYTSTLLLDSATVTITAYTYWANLSAPAFTLGTRAQGSTVAGFSAAIGEGLIASQEDQTVLGRYNVEDTDGKYAVIVGNGAEGRNGDMVRSNALTVDWDGNVTANSIPLGGWTYLGTSSTTATSYTLASSHTHLLLTAHNSTPALNGLWIVRPGGNKAFNLSGGGNVTVTVSGTTLTLKTSAGTINAWVYELPVV